MRFAEVALAMIGLHYHARWPRWARAAFFLFLILCGLFHGSRQVATVRANLAMEGLPAWDYLGFWLHARTAVLGQNFYDPAHARRLAVPHHPTPEFAEEIVDAGFWYPPPSMFLFWPLGAFEPRAALPWWYAFHAAALGFGVVLLKRAFFASGGAVEWLACAVLALAIHGTETTFRFSQTNFVALAVILLLWRARRSVWGGAWTAVALFVKPFLAVLALQPLLARRGRVLLGAGITAVALMLAAAVAFGPDTMLAWFTRDPAAAKPYWIYDQPTNQSLLGMVLRITRDECGGGSCMTYPPFLAGAAVLALATLVIGWRLERAGEEEWTLSLLLLLGLLLYPVSQVFYSVLILPPALLLWRERERLPGGAWAAAALVGAVFWLAALEDGLWTGHAYLLLWGVMAAAGFALKRARPAAPAVAE